MRAIFIFLFSIFSLKAERITLSKTSMRRCHEQDFYRACYELSYIYLNSNDKEKAKEYAQKGCEIEMTRGCSLEESFNRSLKAIKNKKVWEKKVDEHIRKIPSLSKISPKLLSLESECKNGNGESCSKAGTQFMYLTTPIHPKRAKVMFEIGCDMDNRSCCSSLSLIDKGIVRVFDVDL